MTRTIDLITRPLRFAATALAFAVAVFWMALAR